MKEEWRIGTDSRHWVSSRGRVRGVSGKILKPKKKANGYLFVAMPLPGGGLWYPQVARMVCRAFHGNPPSPDFWAAHKNNRRADNRETNLEWRPPAQRLKERAFACGEDAGSSRLTKKNVLKIRAMKGSSSSIAKQFKCSPRTIRDIKSRKTWKHLTDLA